MYVPAPLKNYLDSHNSLNYIEDGDVEDAEWPEGQSSANTVASTDLTAEYVPMHRQLDKDMTVVLLVTKISQVQSLVKAVLAQTLAPQNIWIVGPSTIVEEAQDIARDVGSDISLKIKEVDTSSFYPKGTAGHISWISLLQDIESEWVWLLDGSVYPEPHHLSYMMELQHQTRYKMSLLGTTGARLPPHMKYQTSNMVNGDIHIACIEHDVSHKPSPVDMTFGSWILHRSWAALLTAEERSETMGMPLPRYISHALEERGNIPTMLIPSPAVPIYRVPSGTPPDSYCRAVLKIYKTRYAQREPQLKEKAE